MSVHFGFRFSYSTEIHNHNLSTKKKWNTFFSKINQSKQTTGLTMIAKSGYNSVFGNKKVLDKFGVVVTSYSLSLSMGVSVLLYCTESSIHENNQ